MLKKGLEEWLDNFNNIIIPKLLENGFKPTPINAREGLAGITKSFVTDIPEVAQVLDDIVITDSYNVPVRIYNPNPNMELPVIMYYHGGGHMAGSVTVYDGITRKIANLTNHIVVSVEYRLAPENPYPAGVIDSYNAVKNIWGVLDSRGIKYKKEISVVGDSGGGAVATSIVMKAQVDDELEIKNQILIYPSVDYTMTLPSIEKNGVGYLLGASKMKWYFDQYLSNGEDRKEVSPLYGEFTNKMPRTLIFTAEYCPLKDEGELYFKKVKEAGVYAECYNFHNMIHTFVNMEDLCKEECQLLYKKMNDFLNK